MNTQKGKKQFQVKFPEGENMELTIKDTKDAFREIFKKKKKGFMEHNI